MIYRREKQRYLFAAVLGVIALANVLFYFFLHRPARVEYAQLQSSIAELESGIVSRRQTVSSLEATSEQLTRFEQDRSALFTNHFLQRQSGYSGILLQLDQLGAQAGVRNNRKEYALEQVPQYGLFALRVTVPVQGGYRNVIDFVRSLETADTFFVIDSIEARDGIDGTDGPSSLGLALAVETYFYQ